MTIKTGKLGTANTKLGKNLVLGSHLVAVGPTVHDEAAVSTLSLTQVAKSITPIDVAAVNTLSLTTSSTQVINPKGVHASETLSLTQSSTSSIRNVFSVDTIGITDSSRVPDTFVTTASSTLNLTQSNTKSGSLRYFAESTLILVSQADTEIKAREVVDNLNLTQISTVDLIKNCVSTLVLTQSADLEATEVSCFSTLNLTQSSAAGGPILVSASDSLSLTQSISTNIKGAHAVSTLVLTQILSSTKPIYVTAVTDLIVTEVVFNPILGEPTTVTTGLSQTSTAQLDAQPDSGQNLSLSQSASAVLIPAGAIAVDAVSTLILTQSADIPLDESASSTLNLTQSSSGQLVDDSGPSTLNLSDSSTAQIIRASTPASNTLDLHQTVTYELIKSDTECDYSPFVGGTDRTDLPTPPPFTIPEPLPLSTGTRFRLIFPDATVTNTPDFEVSLRPPLFDNSEGIQSLRINETNRGGESIIFADPTWPKFYRMTVQFSDLKQVKAYDTLSFLDRTLGNIIGIEDHEGQGWKGIITNPQEALVQDGNDRYSLSLELELEKVDKIAFESNQALNLSQSSTAVLVSGIKASSSTLSMTTSSVAGRNRTATSIDPLNMNSIANSIWSGTRGSSSNINTNDQSYGSIGFPTFSALLHRWDATEISSSDSAPISVVANTGSSGVDLHHLNMNTINAPVYKTSILGGQPVIRFEHGFVGQGLVSDSNLVLFPARRGTIVALLVPRGDLSSGSTSKTIFENRNLPSLEQLQFGQGSHLKRPVSWAQNPDATETLETPGIDFLPQNESQLLIITRDTDTSMTFRRNRVDQSGRALASAPSPTSGSLIIGGGNSLSDALDYDLAFFAVYDKALNSTEVENVESYVNVTYGV